MKRMAFSAMLLTGIILFGGIAAAAERHVPNEYSTIQSAINDCNNSDVVIIEPNTYTGTGNRDIDFLGKAITVRSIDPEDPCVVAATIIDCNGSYSNPHRGFFFHTGEDANSVLDGLTIKRGYVYDNNGGGIYCDGASPSIKNCVITGNTAYGWDGTISQINGGHACGGGVFCKTGSNAKFLNCSISYNIACGGKGKSINPSGPYEAGLSGNGYGGGICSSNSNISIIDCTVSNNQARGNWGDGWYGAAVPGSNGYGGGICSTSDSNSTISNCAITDNTAFGGNGQNGSLDAYNTDAGHGYGGGIYFDLSSQPIIENCDIAANSASGGFGGSHSYRPGGGGGDAYGGGMYGSLAYAIRNCLVAGNTASGGNGGNTDPLMGVPGGNGGDGNGAGIYLLSDTPVKNSTLIGNTASNGLGGSGSPSGTNGSANGGGVYCEDSPVITDTILWGNVDSNGTSKTSQIYDGSPIVSYCCTQGGVFSGTGNISADPCFVTGPSGNYYLSQITAGQATNSPCVDAGSDIAANLGMNLKTTRSDEYVDSEIVDMGYHYPTDYKSPDLNRDAFIDFFDYALFSDDWQLPPDPCDSNNGDIKKDGQVDIYDLDVFVEYWLNCLVNKAFGPEPPDSDVIIDKYMILRWTPDESYTSHDIYFGTDFNEVSNADINDSNVYMGNQDINSWDVNNYDANGLLYDTLYYWRIDEIGARCEMKGNVWSFTVDSGKASNPQPSNGQENVTIHPILSWSAGIDADSHDVYFGTNFNEVNSANFISEEYMGNQDVNFWDSNNFDDNGLDMDTTYYWRVDERNACGTSKGEVWSFTTGILFILLQDGFEIGFDNWTTDWTRSTSTYYSGIYSAHAVSTSNDLVSKNINTLGYNSITISFWYREDRIDDDDNAYLQLYNGSDYVNYFELGNSTEGIWNYYTTTITDSQYSRSDFRIKFEATENDFSEELYIDDVNVAVQ